MKSLLHELRKAEVLLLQLKVSLGLFLGISRLRLKMQCLTSLSS